jgi:hypothetical protein
MAARRPPRNTNGYGLQQAMTLLIHNQAQLAVSMAKAAEREDENRQRFSRIERELDAIKAMLMRHEEILQKLPEALRDKIGFKS